VSQPARAARAPYHHGDLRTALVAAATELAREGGPNAIVLRETARRVGVSQTAAYRHFSALPDLVGAVAGVAQNGIAVAMQAELVRVTTPPGTREGAIERLRAVGRGYVRFALGEPGLYATAFTDGHGKAGPDGGGDAAPPADPDDADDPEPLGDPGDPYQLLQTSLGGLIEVGLLDPVAREQAAITAWAAVHGLSTLLLGPMSGIPAEMLEEFIDSCLELVAFGLVKRDG
jgi:AcrR family transcriptional regulator